MSNQNMTPYVFGDEMVRVRQDGNGDPWFVAKDVCRVLGIQNPSDTVRKVLEEDERGVDTIYTPGGEQEVLTVSESGLYALIFRSRKPEAKAFRKWVTSEVLPAIRKTGRYEAAPTTGMDILREMARTVPIRAAQRVQMMSLAVRVCREEGCCTEPAVLSRYVSLCDVVAGPQLHDPELVNMAAMSDMAGLLSAFVEEALIITPGAAPESRTRSARLYEVFTAWCAARGIPAEQIPTLARFGSAFKVFPGIKRCPPINVVNYNVVVRPEAMADVEDM